MPGSLRFGNEAVGGEDVDGESGAAFLERAKAAAPAPEQAKAAAPLAQSSLNVIFDADFYRRQPGLALDGIAPLTHYLARGWKEGRDPCALFDTRFYLSQLPEAASSGLAPLLHYITVGVRREVSPSPLFDLEHYRRQAPDLGDANPLAHYVTRGAQAGLSPHPLFDPKFYLERAPHAREKARSALEHFIEFGASEKLSPHAMFDTAFYVDRYPDVARAGVNPLAHYLLHGRGEGRTVTRLAAPTNRTSKRSPVEGDVARNFPRLRHRKPANVDLAQLKALLCGEQFDASRIDSDITNYFYPSSGNRIVIYTAIFGKYDALKEPDYVDAEADYVCFTDQPDIVSNVFDVVQVSRFLRISGGVRAHSRRCRMFFCPAMKSVYGWMEVQRSEAAHSERFWRWGSRRMTSLFMHTSREIASTPKLESVSRKRRMTPTLSNARFAI